MCDLSDTAPGTPSSGAEVLHENRGEWSMVTASACCELSRGPEEEQVEHFSPNDAGLAKQAELCERKIRTTMLTTRRSCTECGRGGPPGAYLSRSYSYEPPGVHNIDRFHEAVTRTSIAETTLTLPIGIFSQRSAK
ncbi:uncharacterized protein MYCGRDRAFT_94628 [Zymoseptoria tritici IPO323]|uniref:Uncharacterized protein n=1 Tax=Zymoseptoria tritici (strain CBS 115943 / IPO323) TaxID=336722 RepID=F9XGK3_ZYMTI|nr:uncharacterized protein MYCGRDRAFT_94628 [Zymoseptoria tritici IPO323]EGP85776.1 hypothetical protein MYCGRDRAFT_94628 [Zymoseptoria tritici IPO323]